MSVGLDVLNPLKKKGRAGAKISWFLRSHIINDYVIDLRTVKRFGFRLKRRKWDKLLLHFASAVELTNGL